MALIGSLALAIRAKTDALKTDLKPALEAIKEWGAAAIAAGTDAKEVDRAMARMRAEALRGKDMGGAVKGFSDQLRNAKTGAAALTGAITALSSEVGGAVGHVTRLGGSLIQSFLAGGPVALGVTALAAGISAIAGASKEAADEVKRVREEGAKIQEDWAKRRASEAEDRQRLRDQRLEAGGAVPAGFSASAANAREFQARARELNDWIAMERERLTRWSKEREELLRVPEGMGRDQGEIAKLDALIAKSQQNVQIAKEALESARQSAIERAKSLALEQDIARTKQEAAIEERDQLVQRKRLEDEGAEAMQKRAAELRKTIDDQKELNDQIRERNDLERMGRDAMIERGEELRLALNKKLEDEREALAEAGEKAAKEREHELRDMQRKQEQHKAFAQGLRDDLELRRAGNEYERERIRIHRELSENLKAAAGDEQAVADARAIAEEKLTELTYRQNKETRERLEAEKQATLEKQKQAEMARQELDVTKKFANFNGAAGGVFGFGKGTVGFGWGGGGDNVRRNGGAFPGAGGKGGGQGSPAGVLGNLKEITPELQKMEADLAKLPPYIERLVGGLDQLGKTTSTSVERVGKAAEKGITIVAQHEKALEAKVRELERSIVRAGAGTGVGD